MIMENNKWEYQGVEMSSSSMAEKLELLALFDFEWREHVYSLSFKWNNDKDDYQIPRHALANLLRESNKVKLIKITIVAGFKNDDEFLKNKAACDMVKWIRYKFKYKM